MPGKFIKKLSQKSLKKVEPDPNSTLPEDIRHEEIASKITTEAPKLAPTLPHKNPLEPLDFATLNHKKKRGKISRSNLKQKRENRHAVLIQSKWRGHCARKTIAERKADKNSERKQEPRTDNAEEEKLEEFKRVPFAQLRRVQFCVDGAVGLPVSCTATRVSCRLLQQDRTPLSEDAAESFSDPQSPVSAPDFDLFMTWKAAALDPSCTLLCRVDTLDRVSLEAKTVGYAALKLCSLLDGTQPRPGTNATLPESESGEAALLNAGRFRLPLLLGKLPDWCPLTEERLEDLPVVPSAYLTVRLFDASVEEPPREPAGEEAQGGENCDGSVASLLYGTYDNSKVANRLRKAGKPDLPLLKGLGEDLRLGRDLEGEEWRELRPLLLKWLLGAFPPVGEMRSTVNPNYTLRFKDSDDAGVLVGLDMLFNMPAVRPRDLPPNSVVGYKTVLQYLRGAKTAWPAEAAPEDNPRFILDDVSQQWDFASSTQRCPVFTDDFKLISNMHLGPNACVLLIVTRVDVTFTTNSSYDLKMPFRQPQRSWWGLLPLRVRSPFYSPEGSRLETRDFEGAFVNAGTHQVPLFEGIPPVAVLEAQHPLQVVLESLRSAEASLSSGGCPCSCLGGSSSAALSPHAPPDEFDEPVFSRSGASAVVRLQDSRLARFATEHIKMNSALLPNTHLLEQLLGAQSKASYRKALFAYDAFKYDLHRSTAELVLPSVAEEPQLLLDGINVKSEADCLEYIDNIPAA